MRYGKDKLSKLGRRKPLLEIEFGMEKPNKDMDMDMGEEMAADEGDEMEAMEDSEESDMDPVAKMLAEVSDDELKAELKRRMAKA